MEDTPIAKRFDKLCNFFFPIAGIGAMSDDSYNALLEQLRTLKIEPSCEKNSEQLGTQDGAPSNEGTLNKSILSPIAVRCAGRPPTVRKESKVDKIIRQAREKKKKAEQREKKKAAIKEKKKAEQEVFFANILFC